MKTINFNDINETLFYEVLDNGLQIYYLPKKGFNKTYVTISTPLGSNVTKYKVNGTSVTIPYGVAHFLEHKIFDQEGYDLSEEFALHDAQVNAYTMNTRTTYLFHCTKNLDTNLKTLLNMVFHPTFTTKGIEKEIGIIEQEIHMYEDDPNTVLYMGTVKNMFQNHPVRNDILGTVESIKTITKDLLYDVHSAFYNPSNMILFITGNFDISKVHPIITAHVPNKEKQHIEISSITEPTNVITKYASKELEILLPNTLLAIKLKGTDFKKEQIIKKEITYSILFDMLLGKSSDTYQELLQKELVNDTFGIDITLEETYGFLLFGGNTNYPEVFNDEMKKILQEASKETLDLNHFKRTKRQIVGGFIQSLNSLEYIANQFTKYKFQGASLFDLLHIAKTISFDDIVSALSILKDEDSYTTFTIYPNHK